MAYLGQSPFGQTVRTTTSVTATAGQTTVYPTGGYTIGYIDVWVNGAKLTETLDYTATDGVSVVFDPLLDLDDQVEIIAYGSFSFIDGVRRSGDTLNGTYTVTGTLKLNGPVLANNTVGSANSVLVSDGSGAYWSSAPLAPITKSSFTGDGSSTTVTLVSVNTTADDVMVFVDGMYYHPDDDYAVANGTLTFTAAPIAGAEIRVRYLRNGQADVTTPTFTGDEDLEAGTGSFDLSSETGDGIDLSV